MNKSRIFLIAFILAIGGVIFAQAISFGYVPYDDPAYIVENRFVAKGLSSEGLRWAILYGSGAGDLGHGGVENLWHPLTWLSHMLDVELFGVDSPGGHHAMSLLLFLLTAIAVMWVSELILGNIWTGFFVALLWMIHPLKVESVVWISERKDILSGLFFLTSLGCVIKSFSNEKRWSWIAYGLFVTALLSKPSVVVLPVLILLVEGYIKGERDWGLKFIVCGVRRWWLWFVSSSVVMLITVLMQSSGSHEFFAQHSSLIERLAFSAAGFWFYLWRIGVPVDLTFDYGTPYLPFWLLSLSWISFLGLIAFVWRKRREQRVLFLGVVWFVVCWLPVSGLFYVGTSFTADRYVYLALAGLLFILVKGVEQLSKTQSIVIFGMVSLLWGALSWRQVGVWENGWTLFSHSTKARPGVISGWVNLGGMYQEEKQFDKAAYYYEKSIKINPLSHMAWYNLGNVKKATGDNEAAERAYRKALEIYPNFLSPALNLGLLRKELGDLEEARDLFRSGMDKEIKMLWLACECELLLKNFKEADVLLRKLEKINVGDPKISDRVKRARDFLNHQN